MTDTKTYECPSPDCSPTADGIAEFDGLAIVDILI